MRGPSNRPAPGGEAWIYGFPTGFAPSNRRKCSTTTDPVFLDYPVERGCKYDHRQANHADFSEVKPERNAKEYRGDSLDPEFRDIFPRAILSLVRRVTNQDNADVLR